MVRGLTERVVRGLTERVVRGCVRGGISEEDKE